MHQVDIKGHLLICYNVSSFISPSPILLRLIVSKSKNSEGHVGIVYSPCLRAVIMSAASSSGHSLA